MLNSLPNVKFFGACTWHIMTTDFPKNLGHIADYENLKDFVYDKLMRNTVSKYVWEEHLSEACRLWPAAAKYLQELAKEKTRWGAPWRLEHFTVGYEASSPVEGSFSAFHRALGDESKSFTGVVQTHVQKDLDKTKEEGRTLINLRMLATDEILLEQRSDPAKECALEFSHKITENFEITNQNSQNYEYTELSLTPNLIARGITLAHSVSRRGLLATATEIPPPPRTVYEINGIKYCACLEDVNKGEPCRHIQCILGGKFVSAQFNQHFSIATDVPVASRVKYITEQDAQLQLDEHDDSMDTGDDVAQMDGVGTFIIGQEDSSVIDLPSQSLSQVTRHAPKKTKKLTSMEKYNVILNEAKVLASIVSADKSTLFSKAKTILKFVRTNIQNMGGEEIKAATSDYLGIKGPTLESVDTYGEINENEVLAPVLKRTAGATGLKRKKSCVETATTSNTGHACSLCREKGHKINKCPRGSRIGVRLTEKTWVDKMALVPFVDIIDMSLIDPVIPSDARALQIIGKVSLKGQKSVSANYIYRAHVVLPDLGIKPGVCHFDLEVIGKWTNCGKSIPHLVFIHKPNLAEK